MNFSSVSSNCSTFLKQSYLRFVLRRLPLLPEHNTYLLLQLNNIESMLLREDEELLSGYLSVNVQTGHGFLTTCSK